MCPQKRGKIRVAKAITSVAQVNLSEVSTVNRQFLVTLTGTINPLVDVTVKTRSALLISTLDSADKFITANTTGLVSKGFAAASVLFTDGAGGAPTIAQLAATDDIVIKFNRSINPGSIKAGWTGAAPEVGEIVFTAADNKMVITGVGTLILQGVAVDQTITPNMTYDAVNKTLTIPMTDITDATTVANATTFTFIPAAAITDAGTNAIDATHIIAR
jgi:hypothetical protein